MNPYLILTLAGVWLGSAGGSYVYGTGVGTAKEKARQADEQLVIDTTRQAAQEGAANAIAKIKVTNTTIQGKTETVVREHVVYRTCVHPPEQLRNINEALTGRPQPPGDSQLP